MAFLLQKYQKVHITFLEILLKCFLSLIFIINWGPGTVISLEEDMPTTVSFISDNYC